jgi:class 3 adenylate cyclase/tetratricopeptide (TPR) repeat protein
MDVYDVVDQVATLLRQRGRLTYRSLKLQFELDDETLETVKEELLFAHPAMDEDGRGIVWTGDAEHEPAVSSLTQSQDRDPASYTPQHLAEKILITRSALEGERKQVTVLFCDLANSTTIAERIGPEAMHTLLNRFFELALDEVHRYEGTVNQFLGDGFMALFGAPIAHENHAHRALLAASSIRQRLAEGELSQSEDVELALRMGLHTGAVIVGAIGDNLRMDYTAVGDTTNVTARLQQSAAAGQIIMSEATHRLVAGYGTMRGLGELALKGKAEPVRVWELLSVRETPTRIEVEAERGLTRFVGREHEVQTLLDCFEQAQAGHGQIVFLVGEAGLGKSRLLLECRRQIGTAATWLQGHALSFGKSMVLHPLIDLLRRNFGIEEDDAEAIVIDKINEGVLRLGAEMRTVLPYLRYVLGVDPGDPTLQSMDPQLRRAELFDALRRLLLRAADVRPQVVVFEDLHWMDNATEAFLQFILDSIPASRVLCLLTYRPGYVHPFGERSYYTRMALPALSTSATVQMARAMLAAEQLPEEVAVLLVQKAEGNPFFVEEVVKSLRETGVLQRQGDRYVLSQSLDDVVIPNTIQGVLMARIDRLDEAAKQTLQLASVIGRECTHRLLAHLADHQPQLEAALQVLKATELLYEVHRQPELTYLFKHALTLDVAYDSLLAQQRQDLHRRIGQVIEALYADHLNDYDEVLAHHFVQAEVWDKGLHYLCKAADKAVQAFATREAVALYDQALEVVSLLGNAADEQTVMAIQRAKANIYFILSDFDRSRVEYEYLLTLARRTEDRVSEAEALVGIGHALLNMHDFDRALVYTQQAIEIAESANATSVLAAAYFVTSRTLYPRGQCTQAWPVLNQALTVARTVGAVAYQSLALSASGILKGWEGEYAEASRFLSEGLQIAREHHLIFPLLYAYCHHGVILTSKGNCDEAFAAFEAGLAFSEKVSSEYWHLKILNSFGWLFMEVGHLDPAIDPNQRSAQGAKKRGDAEMVANAELNLADIFISKSDLSVAQEFLDGVYRLAQHPATSDWMKWRYSTHLFASLGELWLARGELNRAEAFADQCLEIATRTNSRKYMVKGWRLKGQIAYARRQWDAAEGWLQQALPLAQTVGNPTQIWQTYRALGEFHTEAKRPEQARQAYQAARDVIDRIKANVLTPALGGGLQQSPVVQQVYDLSGPA